MYKKHRAGFIGKGWIVIWGIKKFISINYDLMCTLFIFFWIKNATVTVFATVTTSPGGCMIMYVF